MLQIFLVCHIRFVTRVVPLTMPTQYVCCMFWKYVLLFAYCVHCFYSSHIDFVTATAQLYADICGITYSKVGHMIITWSRLTTAWFLQEDLSPQKISDVASTAMVPDYKPSSKVNIWFVHVLVKIVTSLTCSHTHTHTHTHTRYTEDRNRCDS